MRHSYEKIIQLELIALGLSILIGIIALIQASVLFITLAIYLIIVSLACDAFIHNFTALAANRQLQSLKQAIRAGILFLLATALIFLF